MPITPRLLRRAENDQLPLQALTAISEMREELDRLVDSQIQNARERGASWTDIAEAMGVTRQAVQQRARHYLKLDNQDARAQTAS
jgi:hypothetical protein